MIQLIIINANCAKRKVAKGIRKTEADDHEVQSVGDIVGVYPGEHKFSATEKYIFDIIEIPGYTFGEFKLPFRKVALTLGNEGEIWQSTTDNKWRVLERSVKHPLSIVTLTKQDIDNLKSKEVPKVEKDVILSRLKNRYKDYTENMAVLSTANN